MKRTIFLCLLSSALAAACGGVIVEGESGHTTGGSGGAAMGGAGGGTAGSGGMCAAPPPPSPTLPNQPGCFTDMGSGWVQIPCLCELWLENAATSPTTATLELAVTPPDQVPALT